jgi:predicted dehydrogenase
MSLNPPVDVALIGTGHRSQRIYRRLFPSLRPWIRLVAVCDPVREHADAFAESMGVPAFYSVLDLVRSQPMEAALVVAPIESHHPISCYLSQHGIHSLVETSMSRMLVLAQEMVRTARENDVVLRIAENFFRFPFDRIAKKIAETGFLGPIKRLTCFHDHTGYHNNSRWIVFYGAYPLSVQAIEHTMPVAPHYEAPHRFHEQETFRARFYTFPEDRLVVDMAGNIKGMLGRYPRPGYTEIDGARGTIVQQATHSWLGDAEVRYCSDDALLNGSRADHVFPIVHVSENNCWASTRVDLPIGRVEYVNPYRPAQTPSSHARRDYYAAAVMGHVVDFARAVREGAPSEYTDEDALMAMMMEVAAHESALRNGERLDLPLTGDLEAERQMRESFEEKYGVDPLDIEGMLAVSFPRP